MPRCTLLSSEQRARIFFIPTDVADMGLLAIWHGVERAYADSRRSSFPANR